MKQLFVVLLVFPTISFAAIPSKNNTSFQRALSAPHKIAVSEIYKMGPSAYKKLNNIAFDSSQPMNTRWKSFMVMTSIGQKKSLPEIDKALRDKIWYMRSAGLLAMQKVNRAKAVEWAKYLLKKDPALMVRIKAVDVLESDPKSVTKDLFWKKLYSKENFHRNESLWIREKMVSHLASFPRKKDMKRWKKALFDKDIKVQKHAVRAIEKLTGQSQPGDMPSKVSLWKKRYQSKTL
jgi:hypothetical protein